MLFFPKNPNYHGPKFWGLSGQPLSRMIGFAAGAGFLLFGFDQVSRPVCYGLCRSSSEIADSTHQMFQQGVLSGLLTLPSFTEVFPELDTSRAGAETATSSESTWQGLTVGLYESECVPWAPVRLIND